MDDERGHFMLREGERIDRIAGTNDPIIQADHVFSYSIDAILLGRFAYVPIQKGNILDLCSGNGVVGLVLAERTKGNIMMVELQEKLNDMANRSIEKNHLVDRLSSVCMDVKEIPNQFQPGMFDTVTCNPPYFPIEANKLIKEKEHIALARHELACTLEDVVAAGSHAVKHGGKLALVHRPERVSEMIAAMRTNRIEPKRLRFCHPKMGKPANIVLLEGTKGGKPGLICESPLIIYNDDSSYTDAFKQEYFRQ